MLSAALAIFGCLGVSTIALTSCSNSNQTSYVLSFDQFPNNQVSINLPGAVGMVTSNINCNGHPMMPPVFPNFIEVNFQYTDDLNTIVSFSVFSDETFMRLGATKEVNQTITGQVYMTGRLETAEGVYSEFEPVTFNVIVS